MLNHNRLLVLFLLVTLFLITGCQNILIPNNVPIVIDEDPNSEVASPVEANILSYDLISNGIVQDISYSGSQLIVLNTGDAANPYSISTLDTNSFLLTPFINSDKRQSCALYDSFDTGIYYIEETNDLSIDTIGTQLAWSDLNKSTTRIISSIEENVLPKFGTAESGKVAYANNKNELILADNQGNQRVFTNSKNYSLLKLAYLKNKAGFIFIATNTPDEEKTNLYFASLPKEGNELSPILISENVIHFSINDLNNQLIFVKNNNDYQSIETWQFGDLKPTSLTTGAFGSAQFTPDGKSIIYTQISAANSNLKNQSIWIMNAEGKDPAQLTAPVTLNSPIVCHPFKSTLFFSIEKRTDDVESYDARLLSDVYQVTYQIQ